MKEGTEIERRIEEEQNENASRILIIDDDPGVREMLRISLKGLSEEIAAEEALSEEITSEETHKEITVEEAYYETKEEILEEIEKGCAAIILDYNLSYFNGIEILSDLRSKGNDVPVLFLTASLTGVIRRQVKDLGAEAASKPINVSDLRERMKRMISHLVTK